MKDFFFPFVALRNNKRGYAVSIINVGLKVIGHDPGPVRPPLTDLNTDELSLLTKIIEADMQAAGLDVG